MAVHPDNPFPYDMRLEPKMKQRTKYTIGVTSIMLTGTLGLATMAFASGDDDGTGGRRHHPRFTNEQKCDHQDEIAERAANAQQRIADRVAVLTEKRAAADAAGETDRKSVV